MVVRLGVTKSAARCEYERATTADHGTIARGDDVIFEGEQMLTSNATAAQALTKSLRFDVGGTCGAHSLEFDPYEKNSSNYGFTLCSSIFRCRQAPYA